MAPDSLPDCVDTRRLIIRIPQPGDGHAHYEALVESLPALRRFLAALPWIAGEQSVELSEAIGLNARSNFNDRKDFQFFIFEKAGGKFVGGCGLYRLDWTLPRAEVGYWCRTSSTGQGFITEAVDAMVGYAFTHLSAARVELVTDVDNLESRKVADRCGFDLEGVHRNARRALDGQLRDMCMYAKVV
ncbi:MAG: GNAT family protein [Pseudomonadota bacterium]